MHEGTGAQAIKAQVLNCRLDEGMKVFASLTCGELNDRFRSPDQTCEAEVKVTQR